MKSFTIDQVNKFILFKQHLAMNNKSDNIIQISDDLCGLQSTGPTEPYLNLLARTKNFMREDLERELYQKRSLGKIRGMRKSLFIVPKELIPIIHNAIKHLTVKRCDKYLEMRNISLEEYEDISSNILSLVDEKEMHTGELKKILNIKKDVVAVISIMGDEMKLIRSRPVKTWKDRRTNYAPFSQLYPDVDLNSIDEKSAIKLLIRKYIMNYGPVTERDISWWIGITKGRTHDALKTLKSELRSIHLSQIDHEYIIHESDVDRIDKISSSKVSTINLVPRLDPYLMGYKDRERYVNEKNIKYTFDVSGNAVSTILLGGKVIGVWDITEKPEVRGKMFLFNKHDQMVVKIIKKELKKIGKFLTDQEPPIKICTKMTPLSERTLGSFMTPLRDC